MAQFDTPLIKADSSPTYSNHHHIYMMGSSKHLFSHQEILIGTEKFLKRVGYEPLPLSRVGISHPDIQARRSEGKISFKIFGLVCTGLEQAADGYTRLAAMQTSLGKEADYVLVMPPINEYPVIQFLTAEKGKWFYEIKKLQFMMWVYNPERETMWCIVGGPKDTMLDNKFVFANRPIDPYIAMLLSKEMMKDDDF